jgi:GDPmannose 4,6-dehydratase
VREFIEAAAGELDMDIEWQGNGLDEVGIDRNTGREIVAVDPRYFRPTEVDTLLGDPSKAREVLGWEARTSFAGLVKEMVAADAELVRRQALITKAGYKTYDRFD